MINIKCSELETARKHQSVYGRLLAIGDRKGGGSHGMFAYFIDVAKLVHVGELSLQEGVRELGNKFLRFNDTPSNKARQAMLMEQFLRYCRNYDRQRFEFVDGWRLIKWGIVPEVMLTGRTPWVVSNGDGYFSYFLAEKWFNWESELRFPLIQQYLVKNNIDCSPKEMQIGCYFTDLNKFEFRHFSPSDIHMAVNETGVLFNKVYTEYKLHKK